MCKKSKGRLYGTACVPPWGGKENLKELERCIKDLGFVAVQVACHYGQVYLDDVAFKPYLKVLNDMKVPVVVHHTPLPVRYESILDWTNLRREMGRIMDQMTAVGRELFSGMFDEFPNLKFIHTMFGGNWFANQKLMTPKAGKKKEAMMRLDMGEGERVEQVPQEQPLLRHHPPRFMGQGPGRVCRQGLRRRPHPVRHFVPGVLQLDERRRGVHEEPRHHPTRIASRSCSENAIKMFNLKVKS